MDNTEYAGVVSDPRCSMEEELQDYDIQDIQDILDPCLTGNSEVNSGVGSDVSQSCDTGNNGENKLDSSQSENFRLNRTDFVDLSQPEDSRLNRIDIADPSQPEDSRLNRIDFVDPSQSVDSGLNRTDTVDLSQSRPRNLNSNTGKVPDSLQLPIAENILEPNQLVCSNPNVSEIPRIRTDDILETRGHTGDGNGKSEEYWEGSENGKSVENMQSDAKTRDVGNYKNNKDVTADQRHTKKRQLHPSIEDNQSGNNLMEEKVRARVRRPSYGRFAERASLDSNDPESKFDNARTVRFVSETNNPNLGRSNSTSDTESFHRPENGLLRQTTRMRMRRMSNTVFNGHYPNRKKTQTPLTPEVGLFND